MRKLVYYVAISIDGYIAAPDGSADFYPLTQDVIDVIHEEYPETVPTHIREQLGMDADNKHFDIAIQGRRSYDVALEVRVTSPFAHLRQYVVSQTITDSPDPAVEIISDDVLRRVRELKAEDGKDIFLIGGSRLAGTLLPEIDELLVKLYPVVAGAGLPMFTTDFSPTLFELSESRTLESGTIVLHYTRKYTRKEELAPAPIEEHG
ncbi:dihydrofolate reductase family protein [Actinopolymorpha pittospori]